MSRTYKDIPYKFHHPEQDWDYRYDSIHYPATRRYYAEGEWFEKEYTGVWFRKKPGILTKKKKHVDTENRWQSTPSWWTNLFMNRPQRQASNQYMRQLSLDIDLEEIDPPLVGNKPHIYYW